MKITVGKIPSDNMLYLGVYLPTHHHPLVNKYIKVTAVDGGCTTSAVYFAKPSDKVSNLALSQKQRDYLLIYDGKLSILRR
jgi:hypothetical protein